MWCLVPDHDAQPAHLINDEQDAMLVADFAQRGDEAGRRREEAALAHDGLDDDGGCVGRRALLLQNPLERVDGRVAAAARLVRVVRLHIWLDLRAWHESSVSAFVLVSCCHASAGSEHR